jgi:hypothetical protein
MWMLSTSLSTLPQILCRTFVWISPLHCGHRFLFALSLCSRCTLASCLCAHCTALCLGPQPPSHIFSRFIISLEAWSLKYATLPDLAPQSSFVHAQQCLSPDLSWSLVTPSADFSYHSSSRAVLSKVKLHVNQKFLQRLNHQEWVKPNFFPKRLKYSCARLRVSKKAFQRLITDSYSTSQPRLMHLPASGWCIWRVTWIKKAPRDYYMASEECFSKTDWKIWLIRDERRV